MQGNQFDTICIQEGGWGDIDEVPSTQSDKIGPITIF